MVREEVTLVKVPVEAIPCRCNHKIKCIFKMVSVKTYMVDQTKTFQYILEISGVRVALVFYMDVEITDKEVLMS